jgi:hypothetical protein
MNPTPAHSNFLETIKPHIGLVGSILGGLGSILLAAVIGFGNYQRKDATSDAAAKDLDRRVMTLENSAATRREVETLSASFAEFKSDSKRQMQTLEDIERRNEAILNQEVRFLRRDTTSHQ